jgi:hypothetical protein
MKDVSNLERVTVRLGNLELIILRYAPSTTTSIFFGLIISTVRLESAGKTIERKMLNVHIDVKIKASTLGSNTGPPAESE